MQLKQANLWSKQHFSCRVVYNSKGKERTQQLCVFSTGCPCTYVTPHLCLYIPCPSHTSCTSVGTRNNCPEKKVVQTEDAHKFADQIGVELYEVSAKENINVEEVSGIQQHVTKICVC